MATRGKGIKSSAQDNFLQPDNVTSLTATDVGTNRPYAASANTTSAASASGTGGAVSLSWTLPAGSPAATAYIITTTPSTYEHNTGSSSTSYTFEGLASNTSYTFTVKGTNAAGTASGTTSSSVTATTVPQAPQSPSATAGVNQNTISWTLGANGGKALSSHDVNGSDGTSSLGLSGSATSTTINDTANTSQTYTIVAKNANGTSLGATTGSVTTLAPFFPPFFPPYFPFFPPFFPPYFPFFPPFFPPYFPSFTKGTSFLGGIFFKCLSGSMDVLTPAGLQPIESIEEGDTLLVPDKDSVVLDLNTGLYKLTENVTLVNDTVVKIEKEEKPVIFFNENSRTAVSLTQPIFTVSNNKEIVKMAQDIVVGDKLVKVDPNGQVSFEEVESIQNSEDMIMTYYFKLENGTVFIAEGILVNQ